MQVESGGDTEAMGDEGQIGPFQISLSYWQAAHEQNPALGENGRGFQNCKGTGSIQYSKKVVQVYPKTHPGIGIPTMRH